MAAADRHRTAPLPPAAAGRARWRRTIPPACAAWTAAGSGMDFAVEGIDCAACINEIEDAVTVLPGVEQVRLNYTSHRLAIVVARRGAGEPRGGVRRARHCGLSRPSVRDRQRRGDRGRPRPASAALPRRGRLRRDEHHAAARSRCGRAMSPTSPRRRATCSTGSRR